MKPSSHSIIIEPKKGWQLINFKELLEYKDLFFLMVLRDITVLYKQTVLGFAWAILNPFFTMIVFSIVFGNLAQVPSDGVPYPVFSFAALVPWTYFSQALTNSTNSLINSSGLLSKVYFPRIILPMTPVFAKLADFGIAFVLLVLMMVYFNIWPTINIIYLPLLILLMIMTASGVGMWLSALAIQFRDVKFAITFLVQLLMFAAPVVWSGNMIPNKYRLIYGLYPMAGVIEGFRASLLGKSEMPWDYILVGSISSLVILTTGALYFRKMEKVFADVA